MEYYLAFYIAFRYEDVPVENNNDYVYKMCMSKTPFKNTETAEELDSKMTNTTKERWEEMATYCKKHLKTKIGEDYYIKYTTLKYGQILEQLGQR